jgi:hypothetical protein
VLYNAHCINPVYHTIFVYVKATDVPFVGVSAKPCIDRTIAHGCESLSCRVDDTVGQFVSHRSIPPGTGLSRLTRQVKYSFLNQPSVSSGMA